MMAKNLKIKIKYEMFNSKSILKLLGEPTIQFQFGKGDNRQKCSL